MYKTAMEKYFLNTNQNWKCVSKVILDSILLCHKFT